jgi:hypothetical protein
MGGPAGSYTGTRTGAQTPAFASQAGGNYVSVEGNSVNGLSVGSGGTYEFLTASFSVSYWIKFNGLSTTNFYRHLGTESSSNGWGATHHTTAGISFTRWTTSGTQEQYTNPEPGGSLIDGAWYHCVGIYNGSTVRSVVNGVAQAGAASSASLLSTSGATLRVGSSNVSSKKATISDFGLWTRELTLDEAAILYSGPRREFVSY